LRFEDLTPTPVEEFPNAGRADKFLDFMELELIPHVEETYRVTANDGRLLHSDAINNIDVDWITVADNRFFDDGQNAEASFVYDDEGHISGLDIDAPDRTFSLSKLDSDR
jgi:hypothetical protein